MRSLSILLLIPWVLASTAQSWSPPGAAWAYHFEWDTNIDYRVEYWYSHDTLIDGLDVKVARAHAFGETGGPPIDNLWWEYSRLEDDVVYLGNSQGNWDTLYWYGEIGDRWWPPGSPMTCPPYGMLEIVDTGTVMIGTTSLRSWQIVTIDSLGEPLVGPTTFVERIGTAPRSPQIWDCNMVIDYFFCDFICYSDSELISQGMEPCEVGMGMVETEGRTPAMRIMPNPAQNQVHVLLDQWEPGSELWIRDGLGSIVDRRRIGSPETLLDLPGFAPGAYQIVVLRPSGRPERSTLVVY